MVYPTISIFLIDDHKVVLDGLSSLLDRQENFTLVGKATSEEIAIKKLSSLSQFPDIIITDYRLEERTGMDIINKLKGVNQGFKFIFLTMISDHHIVNECWNSGCGAYVCKSIEALELIQIINQVNQGGRYISSKHLNLIKNVDKIRSLSLRESEIMEYIKEGYSSKEISDCLHISKRTVDNHRFNILRKYNCKNTIQLLRKHKIEEIAS